VICVVSNQRRFRLVCVETIASSGSSTRPAKANMKPSDLPSWVSLLIVGEDEQSAGQLIYYHDCTVDTQEYFARRSLGCHCGV
jgi:hypothetical protein